MDEERVTKDSLLVLYISIYKKYSYEDCSHE